MKEITSYPYKQSKNCDVYLLPLIQQMTYTDVPFLWKYMLKLSKSASKIHMAFNP